MLNRFNEQDLNLLYDRYIYSEKGSFRLEEIYNIYLITNYG